jgi:ribonucleoside-diphosphate reductase alpha chain
MSQTSLRNAVINGHDSKSPSAGTQRGLTFKRFFTKAGQHPFDEIDWELRTALIQKEKGQVIFEQANVEVPREWSMTATNIVASKYFHGKLGTVERESSVRQLISRVADTISQWGAEGSYFRTQEDAECFRDELTHLLARQKAAFNSPVWFNCGLWHKDGRHSDGGGWYWGPAAGSVKQETEATRHPQCSACFINSVQDNLPSILELAKTEAMLFKYGSGMEHGRYVNASRVQVCGSGGLWKVAAGSRS